MRYRFVFLCLALFSELRFSVFLPSVIASACVMAAIRRLKLLSASLSYDALLQQLASSLGTDLVSLASLLCCSNSSANATDGDIL